MTVATASRRKRKTSKKTTPSVRCAIYTRKSTEEGLEQEFNTLDAQRESAEAYITSMKHEGWTCLPQLYDDGGFTGGNMERPAVKQLIEDIEAGEIDCVIVYKVDRLSKVTDRLLTADRNVRQTQSLIRERHSAVQYHFLDGEIDAEYTFVVCPV